MRGAWTGRFGLALAIALVTAAGTAALTWQVTSPRPVRALAEDQPVVLEHWTLVSRGIQVGPRLAGPESDEPVQAAPGAAIALLSFDLTYTDPAVLHDSLCDVVFRTRDERSEWRADNAAAYEAFGSDDHSCLMDPAEGDEPAEVELGETVSLTFSVEVPADVADELVAELRLSGSLDQGSALRWHNAQAAAYLIE